MTVAYCVHSDTARITWRRTPAFNSGGNGSWRLPSAVYTVSRCKTETKVT